MGWGRHSHAAGGNTQSRFVACSNIIRGWHDTESVCSVTMLIVAVVALGLALILVVSVTVVTVAVVAWPVCYVANWLLNKVICKLRPVMGFAIGCFVILVRLGLQLRL